MGYQWTGRRLLWNILVYACDGLPMDRKEIIMKFADKSSVKNFYGKPKIFVFQVQSYLLIFLGWITIYGKYMFFLLLFSQ